MFTKEGRDDDGKTVSAGIEGDLSKIDRNHAVAEMEIAKAPVGAWTGKLITGETRGSADVVAAHSTDAQGRARALRNLAALRPDEWRHSRRTRRRAGGGGEAVHQIQPDLGDRAEAQCDSSASRRHARLEACRRHRAAG